MAHVQPHAKPFHFADSFFAKLRQTTRDLFKLTRCAAACGKGVPAAPGETRAPHAQIIEGPKQGQIISQRIEALQGQQDRNPACGQVLFQFRAADSHPDAVAHRLYILLQGCDLPQSLPKPQLR